MNVIDSSCWLEYLAGSKVGESIASVIEKTDELIVPSITIYEVFKKLCKELDEDRAMFITAQMKQGKVIDLDSDLAIYAGKIGIDYNLSLADSIIYATTLKYDAVLYTQDKHFKSLNNTKYYKKEEDN